MPLGGKDQNEKRRVQELIMAETSLPRSIDREDVWVYMLGVAQLVEH